MSIVESVEPRIQNVKVASDAIVAYLVDGRVLSVPLRGPGVCRKRRLNNEDVSSSSAMDKECTGRRSMKTSALKECFTACRHIVHKSLCVSVALKQMVIGLQLISG